MRAVWLLARRDIVRHLGRFVLQIVSLVVLAGLSLNMVAGITSAVEAERSRQELFRHAWVVGTLLTAGSAELSPLAHIPADQVERLLGVPGIDRRRSFRAMSFHLANAEGPKVTVFAADSPGLAQRLGVSPAEITGADSDQLWLGQDLAAYFDVGTGERLTLAGQSWHVTVVPNREAFTNSGAAMTLAAAHHLLQTGPSTGYVVLYGEPDPELLRATAGSLTLYPPGATLPAPLLPSEPRDPAILWELTGSVVLFLCTTWMFGATYSLDQRMRAGTLRAVGSPAYMRAGPLVLLTSVLVLFALSCGMVLLTMVSATRLSGWQWMWILARRYFAPIVLPLAGAALLTLLPHVWTLLCEPCVPRQQRRYPLLPIVLLLAWMGHQLTTVVVSDVTERRRYNVFNRVALQSIQVTDITTGGSAQLDAERVRNWLVLNVVDPVRSYAELRAEEVSSATATMITRGIAPSDLPKLLAQTRSTAGTTPELVSADSVIVGHWVAGKLGVRAGETVHLYGHTWRVATKLEPSALLDDSIIFPLQSLAQATGRQSSPNRVTLYPHPGSDLSAVQQAVASSEEHRGPAVIRTPRTWAQVESSTHTVRSGYFVIDAALCVAVFAAMWTICAVRARTHLRELAVLRALGATRCRAARGMLVEGFNVAFGSMLTGLLLTYAYDWSFSWPLDYGWVHAAYAGASALMIVAATLGTIPPALKMLRKPMAAALRME